MMYLHYIDELMNIKLLNGNTVQCKPSFICDHVNFGTEEICYIMNTYNYDLPIDNTVIMSLDNKIIDSIHITDKLCHVVFEISNVYYIRYFTQLSLLETMRTIDFVDGSYYLSTHIKNITNTLSYKFITHR